jgi:hypothetical protein
MKSGMRSSAETKSSVLLKVVLAVATVIQISTTAPAMAQFSDSTVPADISFRVRSAKTGTYYVWLRHCM